MNFNVVAAVASLLLTGQHLSLELLSCVSFFGDFGEKRDGMEFKGLGGEEGGIFNSTGLSPKNHHNRKANKSFLVMFVSNCHLNFLLHFFLRRKKKLTTQAIVLS